MAWQWANLDQTLDRWLDSRPNDAITRSVLEAMWEMANNPYDIDDGEMAFQSPLVRQYVVPDTNVLLVYLVAEQYRTFRLLSITEIS